MVPYIPHPWILHTFRFHVRFGFTWFQAKLVWTWLVNDLHFMLRPAKNTPTAVLLVR